MFLWTCALWCFRISISLAVWFGIDPGISIYLSFYEVGICPAMVGEVRKICWGEPEKFMGAGSNCRLSKCWVFTILSSVIALYVVCFGVGESSDLYAPLNSFWPSSSSLRLNSFLLLPIGFYEVGYIILLIQLSQKPYSCWWVSYLSPLIVYCD